MIVSLLREMVYKWRYRDRGVTVKRGARVRHGSELEGDNRIGKRTVFRGVLGRGSYIGTDCDLSARVGRFSSIAPFVRSNPGIHTYKSPFVSTSPMFFNRDHLGGRSFATYDVIDNLRFADKERKLDVVIGNDCWIGQGVFFAGGVTIGDGAVVLAGAVVTKDVAPYAIAGGIPARVVGYRYDLATIKFLLTLEWWNFSEEWLRENWMLLNDIEKLKAHSDKPHSNHSS